MSRGQTLVVNPPTPLGVNRRGGCDLVFCPSCCPPHGQTFLPLWTLPPPCASRPGSAAAPPGTFLFPTSFPNPSKTSLMPLLDAKNEPKASKITPKWSPNGSLVGIKKTLRHHLDKKVPTSTKPHYLLCFVKIHHLFKPLNFDAFWLPKPIKK